MSNRDLASCPVCGERITPEVRVRMGLRSGAILNELCPGANGPSDIDHILHNGRESPERVAILEYKNGVEVPRGQTILLNALRGQWRSETDGRRVHIRYDVLPQEHPSPWTFLDTIVGWVWPHERSKL